MNRPRIITVAIVAVGMAALAALLLRPHTTDVHVKMPLTAARQLREGTTVYLGGVEIGSVDRVPRVSMTGQADVVLRIHAPVARDSQVFFLQQGILSDLSLEIKPGMGDSIENNGTLAFASQRGESTP